MPLFNSKNTSPARLSLYNALIMASLMAVISIILNHNWIIVLVVAGITFCVAYTLYFYTLQYFIYRKIKLIYKFINQTKATRRSTFLLAFSRKRVFTSGFSRAPCSKVSI